MITEHDLKSAIAECQGDRNPNANTCIKLAAYYQILDRLYGKELQETSGYSFSSGNPGIPYSDSPFSVAVEKKGIENVFPVLDELMETLYVINPPLYDSIMRKIEY